MRKPFGRLMLELRNVDKKKTLGEISEELAEPIERISDAIEADKILSGKPAYIGEHGYVFVDPVFDDPRRTEIE